MKIISLEAKRFKMHQDTIEKNKWKLTKFQLDVKEQKKGRPGRKICSIFFT